MGSKLFGAAAGMLILASFVATSAEAGRCKARLDGRGEGQGILGAGSMNARAAARDDFEAKAAARYGRSYGNLDKAKGQVWDCRKGAIKAVCVVTATPCN